MGKLTELDHLWAKTSLFCLYYLSYRLFLAIRGHNSLATPCLAGPQPQPRYRWRRPSLPILIHTVDCKIVGPGNYPKRISAQLQIFEVKFANIWNANFWHQNYYGPLLFTQRSKNKCLMKKNYLQKVCTFAKIAGEICKNWKTWFLVLQPLQISGVEISVSP